MISDNIAKIKGRIASICSKINIDPASIIILAVSKNRSVEQIKELVAAGLTDIGENKVQEALLKYNALHPAPYTLIPIRWHMVGHLQTNKVKEAVRMFDLIQSVDSLRLAVEINKEALKLNKVQDILIEVKTSPEETKFGLMPDKVADAVKEICNLKNIRLRGLMTVAPLVQNPGESRPYFKQLKELSDRINVLRLAPCALNLLSMGMSEDFEIAIEEGANMVRLGRAIFSDG